MSDTQKQTLVIPEPEKLVIDELKSLKQKADVLGVTYSNNIGIDSLREKINEHLNGLNKTSEAGNQKKEEEVEAQDENTPLNEMTDASLIRKKMYEEEMRLIRVRINNLNPAKRDVPGEILTVHNKYIGTVRKYIPFGEVTDEGYHVPYILLKVLQNRKFALTKVKKSKSGTKLPSISWVKEFNIEILPPLTKKELQELARKQAAAQGVEL